MPVCFSLAAALQVNYGMLRKRGQRCTYQNLRAAVEEHTSKRFLVSRAGPPWPDPQPCCADYMHSTAQHTTQHPRIARLTSFLQLCCTWCNALQQQLLCTQCPL